jgi:hypothetical protein
VKNTDIMNMAQNVWTMVDVVDGELVIRCGLLAAGTNQLCYVRTYDGETDEQTEEENSNSSGVLSLESKLG